MRLFFGGGEHLSRKHATMYDVLVIQAEANRPLIP